MSYQVGLSCYATVPDAGQAACASFVPVSSINGDVLTSITCESADSSSGALNLHVVLTSLSSGGSSFSTVQEIPAFPSCVNGDYLAASEQITGALLSFSVVVWGAWKVVSYLRWNRGDHV